MPSPVPYHTSTHEVCHPLPGCRVSAQLLGQLTAQSLWPVWRSHALPHCSDVSSPGSLLLCLPGLCSLCICPQV